MSKKQPTSHDWSAIIYGRSYYIDFRFITLPEDFSEKEKSWASRHILATLDRANKLSANPRWSIFKSPSHCVVGVTCMVRDLLEGMDQEIVNLLSKDNRGRPLYIFVGYVTQINRRRQLLDFPAYTDLYLQPFQNLYRYILEVWWKEEYEVDSKKPIYTNYKNLEFNNSQSRSSEVFALARQINHQAKYPNLTYLWDNNPKQRERLWTTTAICHQPVSLCISDRSIREIKSQTSPFLNQTAVTYDKPVIQGCAVGRIPSSYQSKTKDSAVDNFSDAIGNKVKEDLKTTINQAKVVKEKSRNLLQRLGHNHSASENIVPLTNSGKEIESDFGFKSKSPELGKTNLNKIKNKSNRDWF